MVAPPMIIGAEDSTSAPISGPPILEEGHPRRSGFPGPPLLDPLADGADRGSLGHRAGVHDHIVLGGDSGEDLDPEAVVGPDRDLALLGFAVLDDEDVGLAAFRLADETRRRQG